MQLKETSLFDVGTEQWLRKYLGLSVYTIPVAAMLWGSWGPGPHFLWGVQVCMDSHFLVPSCLPVSAIHSISSAGSGWILHARWFLYYIKHQCGFHKAVWLHKLHQNVWQRVSGLCPDPLGSPRHVSKKGGFTEGERWPQAWTPKIYDRSPPLLHNSVFNYHVYLSGKQNLQLQLWLLVWRLLKLLPTECLGPYCGHKVTFFLKF